MAKEFVLVAGVDESGVSDFHLAEVETSQGPRDPDEVLSEAVRQAESAGFSKPFVCFDENEFQAVADAGKKAARVLYSRRRGSDLEDGFGL